MDSPLPIHFIALWLGLPGIWLGGRALARSIGGDAQIARAVTPALSVSLWLLAIHVIARSLRSFSAGLVAGTVLVSLGGLVADRMTAGSHESARYRRGRGFSARAWILALAAVALLAPSAVRWVMHDEHWPTGHVSTPASMHNDMYPPFFMTFPDLEQRYHYGFDLLAAVIAALCRLRIYDAIDLITLVSWGYLALLLWLLGERVAGRGAGIWVAFVTLFGGGLAYLQPNSFAFSMRNVLKDTVVDGLQVNPPLTSYIFQHPWGLGLPIGLAALLIAHDRRCRHSRRYAALALLLVMLSLSQVIVFLTFTGVLLAQEVLAKTEGRLPSITGSLRRGQVDVGRSLAMAITVALTFIIATRMGGFLLKPYDNMPLGLELHLGITRTWLGSLKWVALSFGLLLPLGVAGLFVIRRERFAFAGLILGCAAILVTTRYSRAWDIVKFATVAAVALSILTGAVLARLASRKPAALWAPLSAIALAGSTVSGLGFAIKHGFAPTRVVEMGGPLPRPKPDDDQAIAWLRRNLRRGEIPFRRLPEAGPYTVLGGIPLIWVTEELDWFGFSPERIARRERLTKKLPRDPGAYLAEGVRYLVLDPSDKRLMEHAARWISEGRARERARFGELRIVEILPNTQDQ